MTCQEAIAMIALNTDTLGIASSLINGMMKNFYTGHEETLQSVVNGQMATVVALLEQAVDLAIKVQKHAIAMQGELCMGHDARTGNALFGG